MRFHTAGIAEGAPLAFAAVGGRGLDLALGDAVGHAAAPVEGRVDDLAEALFAGRFAEVLPTEGGQVPAVPTDFAAKTAVEHARRRLAEELFGGPEIEAALDEVSAFVFADTGADAFAAGVLVVDDDEAAAIDGDDAVEAAGHLAKIELNEDRTKKTQNGLSTRVFDVAFADGEVVQMLDEAKSLIAIGFYDAAENVVQPKVVLV